MQHTNTSASGSCDPTRPFTSSFEAIHMSLIPKGPRRGWVIVWNNLAYVGPPAGQQRYLHYALYDPKSPVSATNPENHCVPMPFGKGDLFCAGHAWTANGDLLVVGGTGCHGNSAGCTSNYEGAVLAYLWRPPVSGGPAGGTWAHLSDPNGLLFLDEPRWYPSVTALGPDPRNNGQDRIMITGGTHLSLGINSYQVWVPPPQGGGSPTPQGSWESNPQPPPGKLNTFYGPLVPLLYDYPRAHLIAADNNQLHLGRIALAGLPVLSDRVSHYAQPGGQNGAGWLGLATWLQLPTGSGFEYNSSVLLPVLSGAGSGSRLLSVGGKLMPQAQIRASAQRCDNAGLATPVWVSDDSMSYSRWVHNTVLLPDGRVFTVGGEQVYLGSGCSEVPALVPEVYDGTQPPGARWRELAPGTIVRDYHSTALLLEDGRVLTAGGDSRAYLASGVGMCPGRIGNQTTAYDYQIYRPDYVYIGTPRPVIIAAPTTMTYGGQYDISYSGVLEGVAIAKVTLVRPGSITHHADPNQRCVELSFVVDSEEVVPTIRVFMPPLNAGVLPRGYYMLHLVSTQTVVTQGMPSVAHWVLVQ